MNKGVWIGVGILVVAIIVGVILYFVWPSTPKANPLVLVVDNPYERNPDGTPNNILIEHSYLPDGYQLSDEKKACILNNRIYADKQGSQYYSVYKDDEDFRNAIDRCLQEKNPPPAE